jgi:hypothetical protein
LAWRTSAEYILINCRATLGLSPGSVPKWLAAWSLGSETANCQEDGIFMRPPSPNPGQACVSQSLRPGWIGQQETREPCAGRTRRRGAAYIVCPERAARDVGQAHANESNMKTASHYVHFSRQLHVLAIMISAHPQREYSVHEEKHRQAGSQPTNQPTNQPSVRLP